LLNGAKLHVRLLGIQFPAWLIALVGLVVLAVGLFQGRLTVDIVGVVILGLAGVRLLMR
jgi:hypothetical protein